MMEITDLSDLEKDLTHVRRCDYYRLKALLQQKKETVFTKERSKSIALKKIFRESSLVWEYPDELPITSHREALLEMIAKNQVTIVSGETGSGKTTILPLLCLEAGRGIEGRIACTQPRRLAATSIAERVASQLSEPLGESVGYKIRFNDRLSETTRIKFMTDGILLAEIRRDPWLNQYDTIIIDEAHERSLNIDFLLGYLQKLIVRRPDLKLIITSATLETKKFSEFFAKKLTNSPAPLFHIEGRSFPVTSYLLTEEQVQEKLAVIDRINSVLEDILTSSTSGDILIFLPTESDINACVQNIKKRKDFHCLTLPLFARLAQEDQHRIFSPSGQRKIIVSTNIAETSLTIPNILFVIDSAQARLAQYIGSSTTMSLAVTPVSQSSIKQRQGRCGRVAPGTYFGLYTQEDYDQRPAFTMPEIQRVNLAEVILRMLSLGLGSIRDFSFIDTPSESNINHGYRVLEELQCITSLPEKNTYCLNKRGEKISRLSLDPRLSCVLLQAEKENCLEAVLPIVTALSLPDIRDFPADKKGSAEQQHKLFQHPQSDFLWWWHLWEKLPKPYIQLESDKKKSEPNFKKSTWGDVKRFAKEFYLHPRRLREWLDLSYQIHQNLQEMRFQVDKGLSETSTSWNSSLYIGIHRSLLSGFLSNIALLGRDNIYRGIKNKQGHLFPSSTLMVSSKKKMKQEEQKKKLPAGNSTWVLSYEWVRTSRLFLRNVASIDPRWLEDIAEHLLTKNYIKAHWNASKNYVVVQEEVRFYGLLITDQKKIPYSKINPLDATSLFIDNCLLSPDAVESYDYHFIRHNATMKAEVQDWEERLRSRKFYAGDAQLKKFYIKKLYDEYPQGCGGLKDLDSYFKHRNEETTQISLCIRQEELYEEEPDQTILERFPLSFKKEDKQWTLDYVFNPEATNDGMSIQLKENEVSDFNYEESDWLVPGLLQEKIIITLKSLPKQWRKRLIPLQDSSKQILSLLKKEGNFYDSLYQALREIRIIIPLAEWDAKAFLEKRPEYLKTNYQIFDAENEIIYETRSVKDLQQRKWKKEVEIDFTDPLVKTWSNPSWQKITSWKLAYEEPSIRLPLSFPKRLNATQFLPRFDQKKDESTCSVVLFQEEELANYSHKKSLLYMAQDQHRKVLKQLFKQWSWEGYSLFLWELKASDLQQSIVSHTLIDSFDAVTLSNNAEHWLEYSHYEQWQQTLEVDLRRNGSQLYAQLKQSLTALQQAWNTITTAQNKAHTDRLKFILVERKEELLKAFKLLLFPSYIQNNEMGSYSLFLTQLWPKICQSYTQASQTLINKGISVLDKEKELAEFYASLVSWKSELKHKNEESEKEKYAKPFFDFHISSFELMLVVAKAKLLSPEIKMPSLAMQPKKYLKQKQEEWLEWYDYFYADE